MELTKVNVATVIVNLALLIVLGVVAQAIGITSFFAGAIVGALLVAYQENTVKPIVDEIVRIV
jgi:hypothetical protein